ncbi:hypothetical protein LCGC14_1178970 [marine sediment metagenome]|uniref:Uncharacterized protein n=1 Tax=marine sediment metagenome TaxID=412755 RepID=A0A0F9LSK2_9ZZZZ
MSDFPLAVVRALKSGKMPLWEDLTEACSHCFGRGYFDSYDDPILNRRAPRKDCGDCRGFGRTTLPAAVLAWKLLGEMDRLGFSHNMSVPEDSQSDGHFEFSDSQGSVWGIDVPREGGVEVMTEYLARVSYVTLAASGYTLLEIEE